MDRQVQRELRSSTASAFHELEVQLQEHLVHEIRRQILRQSVSGILAARNLEKVNMTFTNLGLDPKILHIQMLHSTKYPSACHSNARASITMDAGSTLESEVLDDGLRP